VSLRAKLIESVANWYHGKYIPPYNPPGSGIIVMIGHYERHWTARAVRAVGGFVATEWKWLLGFVVAVLAVATNIFLKH
jgi:hypothetical protein